ncbi:MAG: leucine/isoleucine/valine transporter permease subunit [Anaerolineae bacterium]|nr:leucine/isoleucine/valine transporter permease subunit [Anaerolineae bacterium]MDW8099480.1 leucine/isoleucine/valine transporter permease subunit [Anaerolineae bacterium]
MLLSLVGMVVAFNQRAIVYKAITMGQVLLLAPLALAGYIAARRMADRFPQSPGLILLAGGGAGLIGGAVIAALLIIGHVINLRAVFINASPALYQVLMFGREYPLGVGLPVLAGLVVSELSAGVFLLPPRPRSAIIQAAMWVVLIGLLRDLLVTVINLWGPIATWIRWLFAQSGLSPVGAVVVFGIASGLSLWRSSRPAQAWLNRFPAQQRWIRWGVLALSGVILLALPWVLGSFFSEILDNVGLYILMGLGLNIVVGFAGLLDLGYVAFYAIGAYSMGVLTSPELGFFNLSYWQALPIALAIAVLSGVLLGLPVLKMRGDYLAIVTLGFGEIIRLLVLSDWLRPYLGGSHGIQLIARPRIGPLELATQQQLYYVILVSCLIAGVISWRLKDSRLGRAWMAVREDQDVAQALGVNPVTTKLLAFATGALFSGLSGTIFAAKLGSTIPGDFGFLVSINVLALIIIGGMGSIPGVVVGALALVGLPGLLREFAEFRLLVYGAVLMAMMLMRPEGLWPEARRQLELHEEAAMPVEEPLPASPVPIPAFSSTVRDGGES